MLRKGARIMLSGICIQLGDSFEVVISGHRLSNIRRHYVRVCFLRAGIFREICKRLTRPALGNTNLGVFEKSQGQDDFKLANDDTRSHFEYHPFAYPVRITEAAS